MFRNTVLSIVIAFIWSGSYAQKMKNNIFIFYNGIDCHNCLKNISNLEYIDKNIKGNMVFKEDLKEDSAALKKTFFQDLDYEFIFSDAISNQFHPSGKGALLTMLMSDQCNHYSVPLVNLDDNQVSIINRLNKDAFSFPIKYSKNTLIKSNGMEVWMSHGIEQRSMIGYNILTQKIIGNIYISDSILKLSYKDIPNNKFDQIKKMDAEKVPSKSQIFDYYQLGDTIFISSIRRYFSDPNPKTGEDVLNNFLAIDVFLTSGKFVKTMIVDTLKNNNYQLFPTSYSHNGVTYMGILNNAYNQQTESKYLATFHQSKDKLILDSELDRIIDTKIYKNENYLYPIYYKNAYMLALDDKIMELSSGKVLLDLNIFDTVLNRYVNNTLFNQDIIMDFRFNNQYAWILSYNTIKGDNTYIKYDIKQQKVIGVNSKLNSLNNVLVSIAGFNFDYVVYNDKNELNFKKIF